MISDGQEAWEEAVAGGRGSEIGVFLTDSKREREGGGYKFLQSAFSLLPL